MQDFLKEELKIGTLNLSLGLPNKRYLVIELLKENKMSICCLQETEIPKDFPKNLLNTGNYSLELELNDEKRELVSISQWYNLHEKT